MDIVNIINKKRLNQELSKEEIDYVIANYNNDQITDYQMSSLLMAITINGMTDEETINLTDSMLNTGSKLDLSMFSHLVDKHSTGGVGDKTTLIVAPLVASCGVTVAKMSGRGLGFTGGTIDKLESIPNFNVNLTKEEFLKQLQAINIAIISQTKDLAIVDKKIYALRDVTGTVESIPLIASSIMSKKVASGSKNLVLDVKVGNGALIKDISSARKLANLMIKIGKNYQMNIVCLLTNMEIPLGKNVGNYLEVEEALTILKDNPENNLSKLCIELASYMVSLGLNLSYDDAKNKVLEKYQNNEAHQKLLELIEYQNGSLLKTNKTAKVYHLTSNKEGYLTNIDALELAKFISSLGASRKNKEDNIDYSVGITLNKSINDYIKEKDILLTIYSNKIINKISDKIFEIKSSPIEEAPIVYEIIK